MLKICGNKGFHITFQNGYTASVQFGPGNYCDNYNLDWKAEVPPSSNAEIACIDPKGKLIDAFDWGDTVKGHVTPNELIEFFTKVAAL